MKGTSYWVRHGESTANERNVFAGLHDVELTPYGRLQAKRAGEDILQQNIKFDAIYVSYLRRARQTCQLALSVAEPDCKIEPVMDMRLAERSFGVFAGRNQNLLKQVYGYHEYEHLLHSPTECPPSAEQIASIYARVSKFYEEEIVPRTARGENVLIVAHQYVIEPLALYLGEIGPDLYKPLNLPNGKALSESTLKNYLKKETGKQAQLLNRVGQETTIYAVKSLLLAVLSGVVLRLIIRSPMPQACLVTLLSLMLGVCTFYTYLDVDVASSVQKTPRNPGLSLTANYAIRWAVIVALVASHVLTLSQVHWGLLFLTPPALTCPTLSILWGGGKYLAVTASLLLSFLLPPALVGLSYAPGFVYSPGSLVLFYVVLGVGLLLPAAVAQAWRTSSPVECARYAKSYKFLSAWALATLAFLASYQYTPNRLMQDLFVPKAGRDYIQSDFWRAVTVFAAMRLTSWFTGAVSEKYLHTQPEFGMDLYVLLTTPNIFLWLGLSSGIAKAQVANGAAVSDATYVQFWAVVFFFCLPSLEQDALVLRFCRSMAATTTKINRLSVQQLQELWEEIQGPGNDAPLDWEGVKKFANAAQKVTTGREEAVNDYVVTKLFELLDEELSGSVAKAELFTYMSNVGLVVDLNTMPTTTTSAAALADSAQADNWWTHVAMPHSKVTKEATSSSGALPHSQIEQLWYLAGMEEMAMTGEESDGTLGRDGVQSFAEQVQWAMSGHNVTLPEEVVDKLFAALTKTDDADQGSSRVKLPDCVAYLTSLGLLALADEPAAAQEVGKKERENAV